VALVVSLEQSDRSGAVPERERVCLAVTFSVRPLDLQDNVPGGDDVRHEAPRERLLELEIPLRGALLDEPRELCFPGCAI
jgi:hypothetical protein